MVAEIIREHWSIENKLHWIRDVTFAEDHSQIRTGNGPAVMATLRNFAVSRHRLGGHTNIAAACRHTSRHPIGPLTCSHKRQINYVGPWGWGADQRVAGGRGGWLLEQEVSQVVGAVTQLHIQLAAGARPA
jgi:hypothetical protein